jgi:hypothetical protein
MLEHGMTNMKSLMDVIEKVAIDFPSIFKNHFQDIIDVLVGWYLDRDTPFKTRQRIATCFTNFRGLWIGNIDFTCGLLDKFIIDMKSVNDERQFNTFIGCFAAIAQALDSLFSLCASKLLYRLMQLFIVAVDRFSDKQKRIWKASSDCIVTISSILKTDYAPYMNITIEYLAKVLPKFEIPHDWLDVTIQLLEWHELQIEMIRPLIRSTLLYAQSRSNLAPFSKLFSSLFRIDGVYSELFQHVPKLEHEQAWNRSALLSTSFAMGMVIACANEKLMEWTWKGYSSWVLTSYFAPSVFVAFLRNLHAHYVL